MRICGFGMMIYPLKFGKFQIRGRTQQVIMAENIKEARKIAAHLARMRGVTEYWVYAG